MPSNTTMAKASRGRPKTTDRKQIITVAMQAYWREDVESVSLNEICRRAEVAKPGLYREFGNEDGLLKAVLVVYPQQVLATVYQRIATDAPFRATLDGLVSIVTRSGDTPFFGDAQAVPSGCLFAKMRESYRHLGEETRAEVDRAKAKILTLYSANIYFYKPLPAVSSGAPARGAPTGSPVRSVMGLILGTRL